jgi:hypothetical protein
MAVDFAVPADGNDLYRCFVAPANIAQDHWVRAVDMRPGNPLVVHHAILFQDISGTARKRDTGSGYDCFGTPGFLPARGLSGWTPGSLPIRRRPTCRNCCTRTPTWFCRCTIIPTGGPSPTAPPWRSISPIAKPTRQAQDIPLGSNRIDIPPGDRAYKVTDHFTLPVDVDAIGINPHAHYICKEMYGYAVLPDGTRRTLLRIPEWNFNWQQQYLYATPIRLPAGTDVVMEFTYDNSAGQSAQSVAPSAARGVGPSSTDEMAGLHIAVVPVRPGRCRRSVRVLMGQNDSRYLAKLEIEQAGGNALRLRGDVRDLEQLQAAVDRMKVVFGGLDALIAAAGVQGPIGPLLSTDPKAWTETIEVNLIGVVNSCRAVLPPMIEKRSGKIILIVGGGSGHTRPNFGAYCRVEGRRGALCRGTGDGSERSQCAGELHFAGQRVHAHDGRDFARRGREGRPAGDRGVRAGAHYRRNSAGEAVAAGAFPGVGPVQSYQREIDSRERRLEALRAGEYEAGAVYSAAGAEDLERRKRSIRGLRPGPGRRVPCFRDESLRGRAELRSLRLSLGRKTATSGSSTTTLLPIAYCENACLFRPAAG